VEEKVWAKYLLYMCIISLLSSPLVAIEVIPLKIPENIITDKQGYFFWKLFFEKKDL
jgi:hypothetical protein